MPTVLFETAPGRVVAIAPTQAGVGAILRVRPGGGGTTDLTFREHRSLVTRYVESDQVNYQVMNTLDRDLYLYTFGDRVGQAVIEGLSFGQGCEPGDGDGDHGLSRVDGWYRDHRLGEQIAPIRLMLGSGRPREGYLVGLTKQTADTTNRTGQYRMTVLLPPVYADGGVPISDNLLPGSGGGGFA